MGPLVRVGGRDGGFGAEAKDRKAEGKEEKRKVDGMRERESWVNKPNAKTSFDAFGSG